MPGRRRHQPRNHHRPAGVQRRRHHPPRRPDALADSLPLPRRETHGKNPRPAGRGGGRRVPAVHLLVGGDAEGGSRARPDHRLPDGALHRRVVDRPADLPRAQHGRPALDRPQQRRAVLRSTVGTRGVRDPALVRSPAGDRYWIIATDLCIGCGRTGRRAINNGSRNLVVWESTDLVNWSAPWLLNVAGAIPDGRNAWAPEAIWNPATGDYVLYWATNVTLNGVDEAPHLLRPHDGLPHHHHAAALHRPRPAARRSSTPRSSRCRPASAPTATSGPPATARSPSRAATRSSAPGRPSGTCPASG